MDGRELRRPMLAGLLTAILFFAQVLFAAHAEDLADHAPQSCEFCLAAAISDDPNALAVEFAPPLRSFENIESVGPEKALVEQALIAANSRGPPYC